MTIIAGYWWLWLMGLVGCVVFAIWRWFGKFYGTAQRITTFNQIGREVFNSEPEKRGTVLTDRALKTVETEAKGWMRDIILTSIASLFSWIFAALLFIAVVIHMIDYFKG